MLNSLKNRGIEDIFIACTDNLTGFSAAIEAVYPKTEIQNCIIHQLRNSSKYVSYKDLKALMADLKAVYAAVDEPAALDALDTFAEHWDKKYPKISQSWRDNWANLSTYFKFPQALRRLIYTTNTIEGFNRQLRKVTKSKSVFPTDDSLFKMLYLAMIDITKKWTGRRQDWSMIHVSWQSTSRIGCLINCFRLEGQGAAPCGRLRWTRCPLTSPRWRYVVDKAGAAKRLRLEILSSISSAAFGRLHKFGIVPIRRFQAVKQY